MSVKGRREEYAEVTRVAIVDAAIERFAEDGFNKTTMDAIADTARVSKGAVYHHFNDKADLFEAAFVSMEERLQSNVFAGVNGVIDPWELVQLGVDIFLEACCEPRFCRIVLEEAPAALGWTRWKEIEERYFLGMVIGAFGGLSDAGLIDVPDANLAARMFLSALGVAGLALASTTDKEAERKAVSQLVIRFVKGLS